MASYRSEHAQDEDNNSDNESSQDQNFVMNFLLHSMQGLGNLNGVIATENEEADVLQPNRRPASKKLVEQLPTALVTKADVGNKLSQFLS